MKENHISIITEGLERESSLTDRVLLRRKSGFGVREGQKRWGDKETSYKSLVGKALINKVIREPEVTPENLHNAWVSAMNEQGWKYGYSFSDVDSTHPEMVAWENTTPEWRYRVSMQLAFLSNTIALFKGDFDDIRERITGASSIKNRFGYVKTLNQFTFGNE